jgi:hypothetical protein
VRRAPTACAFTAPRSAVEVQTRARQLTGCSRWFSTPWRLLCHHFSAGHSCPASTPTRPPPACWGSVLADSSIEARRACGSRWGRCGHLPPGSTFAVRAHAPQRQWRPAHRVACPGFIAARVDQKDLTAPVACELWQEPGDILRNGGSTASKLRNTTYTHSRGVTWLSPRIAPAAPP